MSAIGWIAIVVASVIIGAMTGWWAMNVRRAAGTNDQIQADRRLEEVAELETLREARAALKQTRIDMFEAHVARQLSMCADTICRHIADVKGQIDLQIHDEVRLDQISSALQGNLKTHLTSSDVGVRWHDEYFAELHSVAVEAALILAPYYAHSSAPMSSTPVGWFENTVKVIALLYDIYQGRRQQIVPAS